MQDVHSLKVGYFFSISHFRLVCDSEEIASYLLVHRWLDREALHFVMQNELVFSFVDWEVGGMVLNLSAGWDQDKLVLLVLDCYEDVKLKEITKKFQKIRRVKKY